MKTYLLAAIILLGAPMGGLADEATDARIAELEARIRSLERQVERLTIALDAAVTTRTTANAPNVAASEQETSEPDEAPPTPIFIAPVTTQDVEVAIRNECMRRQTYEHAIGGPAPNYNLC